MAPEGWRLVPLSALANFVNGDRGKNYPSRSSFVDVGIPFINAGHIENGRVNVAEMNYITQEAYDRLSGGKLAENDLIYCLRGSLGKLALISGVVVPGVIASSLVILRPRDCATPKYLYYAIAGPLGTAIIRELDSGSAQPNISATNLQRHEVLVPPLPEQQKIAAILSSVDEVIEKTEAVIEQLQVVKKAMMQELLTRGLPGRHTRFKKTEIGEIPEEWTLCSIDALGPAGDVTVRTGPFGSSLKSKDFRASGLPVLTIQSLGQGEVLWDGLFFVDEAKATELSDYAVRPNDVVFSRVADIGRCVAIHERETGWLISSNLSRIRLDQQKADAGFLMYLLTTAASVLRQVEAVAGNAGRPVITSTTLKMLQLPIPPIDEQRGIAAVARTVEERVRAESEALAQVLAVKSALMSVLLTGELRVTPDEAAA